MALAAPKITVSTLKTKYKFTPTEFVWPAGTASQLTTRLSAVITFASRRVQQLVGTTTYASTDDLTAAMVVEAEMAFAGAEALQERLVILSSRPEEAPPEEYIDLGILEAKIESLQDLGRELIAAYITEDLDLPGTGFVSGAVGVDETEPDRGESPYVEIDFGEIPS